MRNSLDLESWNWKGHGCHWPSVTVIFGGALLSRALKASAATRATVLGFCLLFWEPENPSKAKGIHLKLAKESRTTKDVFAHQETDNMEQTEKVWDPECL